MYPSIIIVIVNDICIAIYEFEKTEGISIQQLEDMCELILKSSKRSIELCGIFFDSGHDEVQKLGKNHVNKKIITLDKQSVETINKKLNTYSRRP